VLDLAFEKSLPKQFYSETIFGKFNITLFNNDKFTIQIYIMDEIDTEIHNHPFDGAFRLLTGKSVHLAYRFNKKSHLEGAIYLGKLQLEKSEVQTTGHTTQINSETIHSIARVEKSNITLIVTNKEKRMNGFFIYPDLYIENHRISEDLGRKVQALSLKKEGRDEKIISYLKSLDIFNLLTVAFRLNNYSFNVEYESNFRKVLNNLIELELESRNKPNYLLAHSNHLVNVQRKITLLK